MPQLSQASAARQVKGSSLAQSAKEGEPAHDRRDDAGAEEVLAHAPTLPRPLAARALDGRA